MSINEYPQHMVSEPELFSAGNGNVDVWILDMHGTRYRLLSVDAGDRRLLCFEPDERFGRTWFGFMLDHYLAPTYVAEKLRISSEQDLEAAMRLVYAAMPERGWSE